MGACPGRLCQHSPCPPAHPRTRAHARAHAPHVRGQQVGLDALLDDLLARVNRGPGGGAVEAGGDEGIQPLRGVVKVLSEGAPLLLVDLAAGGPGLEGAQGAVAALAVFAGGVNCGGGAKVAGVNGGGDVAHVLGDVQVACRGVGGCGAGVDDCWERGWGGGPQGEMLS